MQNLAGTTATLEKRDSVTSCSVTRCLKKRDARKTVSFSSGVSPWRPQWTWPEKVHSQSRHLQSSPVTAAAVQLPDSTAPVPPHVGTQETAPSE